MSVFDLDERGQRESLSLTNGVRFDQLQTGFFDGTAYGAGMGVARGAANLARNVSLLAGGTVATVLDQVDNAGATTYRDRYFKFHDETFQSAADYWTPTASEVGTMGRIIGGLGEAVAPLALGPIGAPAMVGSMAASPMIDLARQGVRPEDAIPVGLAQGTAAAVGFRIPFVGNTLTQRMAAGAAGNLATNVPAQIASQGVLRTGGYEAAIIDQYDPWDVEARGVDVLAGAVFGAVAHAAMVSAKNAKHYQSDSAPRPPADQTEAAIHSRGMDATLEQMIAGEPVNVPGDVARQFADAPVRPDPAMLAAIEDVVPDLAARVDEAALREPVVPDAMAPPADAVPTTPDAPAPKPAEPSAIPELTRARAILEAAPDLMVRLDDDSTVRAADLVAEMEADYAQTARDADAFGAAVECMLRTAA